MQIATRYLADTVIATPVGRIDHQSAKQFEAALTPLIAEAAAQRGALVLDFSGVDYISSVGLRVLMIAAKQLRERRAQLLVAALQTSLRRSSRSAASTTSSRVDRDARRSARPVLPRGARAYRSTGSAPPRMKRVRFWGTRGSLPVALTAADLRKKLLAALRGRAAAPQATEADLEALLAASVRRRPAPIGGHTSCVEIETGEPGLRPLRPGQRRAAVRPGRDAPRRNGAAQTFHVFMSHLHWDHIMGLPFFVPAYIPGNRVVIYGGHAELEAALRRQQEQPSFPVDFSIFGAEHRVRPPRARPCARGRRHDGDARCCSATRGDSYGYRFEAQGGVVVYSTDSEHPLGAGRAHRALRRASSATPTS